jgi:phenylacetic acid degradation protein PaaD
MHETAPALTPTQAQSLAERVADAMFGRDRASQGLGMRIVRVAPGYAEMAMTVRPDMVNGHAICHGGFVFTLADSAFAFACNSYNANTVANGCTIEFLAPATGRRADRRRPRADAGRPQRRLRRRGAQPVRRHDCAVPRQEHAHQGPCSR